MATWVRLLDRTVLTAGLSLMAFACSADGSPRPAAVGGDSATGGSSPATGGDSNPSPGTGGSGVGTGGLVSTGGLPDQTGGTATSGGGTASGSTCAPGLRSGTTCDPTIEVTACDLPRQICECAAGQWACTPKTTGGTGGVSGTGGGGGTTATGGGGSEATGGASVDPGTVQWGKKEDPSAGCPVPGNLPGYSELQANSKLPDPFMMLDGNRITSKSEWACRREELLHQVFEYIYGEKPIPAEGSVSGTVSSNKISVKVSEGGKSCSFDVTVDMNGATAPAPAIIYYDGGMGSPTPIPSGVAKIRFSAIESQGGSGAKNGPFYTFYGSNHPAGYMVAQAWQVSRIIDLLEQQPDVIDPYHIGVTGCSRNGKGAFAAGVFDNRIALTIPCESGMGGTVGLRLKEQLDPGDNSTAEWPYHAISYVRWLSDVALGPFAKSNDANGDNTDRLPVDMHSAMALIAPRAIYIVDNPGISNLDPKSAYVTASAGKAIFEALGVGDHFAYQGASGQHCQWRQQYGASLNAMIDRFLKGNDATQTGNFATDLGGKPNTAQYYSWDTSELSGDL